MQAVLQEVWSLDGQMTGTLDMYRYGSFTCLGKHRGNQSDPETKALTININRDIFKVFVSTVKQSGTYGSLCQASVCPCICLSGSHTFLVVTHSYVS